MFARHLISTALVPTGPHYTPSDRGVWEQYVEWSLDRAAGVLYRTPSTGLPALGSLGRPGATGRVSTLETRDKVSSICVFDTTNEDFVEPPVATYPYTPPTNTSLLDLSSSAYVYSNNPQLLAPFNAYAVTYFDFIRNQTFKPLTIPMTNIPLGLYAGTDGDHTFVLPQMNLGYKQATSAAWFTALSASNGRGARASIPRQIYDEQGLSTFVRLNASTTPDPIAFVAWRRPLTTSTRVRGMSVGTVNGAVGYGGLTRAGKAYLAVTVTEIEIGPSTGTARLSGQDVTLHGMVEHLSTYVGYIVLSGSTTTFVVLASSTVDRTTPVSQYLASDGTASGEFAMTSSGVWSYIAPVQTLTGSRPLTVTARNILATPLDQNGNTPSGPNTPFNVTDLAGQFVKTGSTPPDGGTIYRLLNADVLLSTGRIYSTCYASYDLGGSWQRIQLWGPRGSTDPKYPDVNAYPTTAELGTQNYHFYV